MVIILCYFIDLIALYDTAPLSINTCLKKNGRSLSTITKHMCVYEVVSKGDATGRYGAPDSRTNGIAFCSFDKDFNMFETLVSLMISCSSD